MPVLLQNFSVVAPDDIAGAGFGNHLDMMFPPSLRHARRFSLNNGLNGP